MHNAPHTYAIITIRLFERREAFPTSSVQSSDCVHEQVAKRIVNVRFTKKEHLLRETSQKSRLHSPAQITQKK